MSMVDSFLAPGRFISMTPLLLLLIVAMLIFGFLCRAIAIKRNLDRVFWFAMGVTFGPLALPFALFTNIKRV